MSGLTNSNSPLHEKACVAGTTILGGAVGSWVPVVGTLTGAGVGFVLGVFVCSRDVISKPIQNELDFEIHLGMVLSKPHLQEVIISKMVDAGTVSDQAAGAILLRYVLDQGKRSSQEFVSYAKTPPLGPATGASGHGLNDLGAKANSASKAS